MNNIIFLGDSFCAHSKHNDPHNLHTFEFHTMHVAWMDLVSEKLKRNHINFGYGGTSWWFGYRTLRAWIQSNPEEWSTTDHMVICLGQRALAKTMDLNIIQDHAEGKYSNQGGIWTEEEFDVWAYEKYIDEIIEWSKTRKIVVLYNFRHECWVMDRLKQYVPVCFTPLMYISCAETAIPVGRIEYLPEQFNHLNPHNNIALGKQIYQQLANYKPGVFQINKSMFDFKAPEIVDSWIKDYRHVLEEVYNNKI